MRLFLYADDLYTDDDEDGQSCKYSNVSYNSGDELDSSNQREENKPTRFGLKTFAIFIIMVVVN